MRAVVAGTVEACGLPGAVVAFARGRDSVDHVIVGTDANGRPLGTDSLFPVASVTKLGTALCALRLVDEGSVELDAPLATYLPDAAAAHESSVTLRTLLTHTSGLPYEIEDGSINHDPIATWEKLVAAWLATPLEAEPRTRVAYSNVGYALVGLLIEAVTSGDFVECVRAAVLEPLAIEGYLGEEPPRATVAVVDPLEPHPGPTSWWNSAWWRSVPWPHVGLHTTAAGAIKLLRAYAPPFLSPKLAAEATTDQTGGLWGQLFDGPEPLPWGLGPSIGHESNARAYRHGSVTSCMVWHDPDSDLTVACLGTRVGMEWLDRGIPRITHTLMTHA